MGFTIDKSVPLPESAKFKRQRGKTKYGFENMEIGDSIFFDGESSTDGCRPYLSASAYGAKYNKRFIARTVFGGVRVWRVE